MLKLEDVLTEWIKAKLKISPRQQVRKLWIGILLIEIRNEKK